MNLKKKVFNNISDIAIQILNKGKVFNFQSRYTREGSLSYLYTYQNKLHASVVLFIRRVITKIQNNEAAWYFRETPEEFIGVAVQYINFKWKMHTAHQKPTIFSNVIYCLFATLREK